VGEGAHSCAIHALTGAVVCWGYDTNGQTTPPVNATDRTASAIAAGGYHSLALPEPGFCPSLMSGLAVLAGLTSRNRNREMRRDRDARKLRATGGVMALDSYPVAPRESPRRKKFYPSTSQGSTSTPPDESTKTEYLTFA